MKKILFCMMACFLLVGCGKDKESDNKTSNEKQETKSKVVCTASNSKMKSKITFTYEDEEATSLNELYTFNDAESAESMCSLVKLGKSNGNLDMEITCTDNSVNIYSENVEEYYETVDIDEIVTSLEDGNFTCK